MQDVLTSELEADIVRLENGIRQLKIQYDMFFAGSIPKQPLEMRRDVEQIIKRYANAPIRKYAPRYHFNGLVSRYNILSELWAKTIRSIEEGDRPAPAVADRAGGDEKIIARLTVQDPRAEKANLALFHERFVEARRKQGDSGKLPLETFVKSVSAQASKLREKTGCAKVELRVIVQDRKVVVKARPGR